MGGLLVALNAGKTSLSTNQKVIEVSGNNIANVNTPGYSRQKAILTPYPSLNFNGFMIGQGVKVGDIVREHDAFLSTQIQDKSAGYGEADAKTFPLAELERVFGISDGGISTDIDSFFDSWQELTANPGGQTERDIVIQRGELLADSFHTALAELDGVKRNIDESLLSKIDGVNDSLQRVADLNIRISTIESSGQTANTFRDERDLLLADLSSSIGIQSLEDKEGNVMVQLPGGQPLVQKGNALTLEGEVVDDELQLQVNTGSTSTPIDTTTVGGAFKGLLEVRDQLIPDLESQLDKLAYSLATEVNALHSTGRDLNDNTGILFFDAPPSPTPPANLWDGAANALNVAISSPDQLAAGLTSAPGDNTIALQIAELGSAKIVDGTDTLTGAYSRISAQVGLEAGQNELATAANEDTMTQLKNLRDGKVGVSLEEEMINLIQYQKGFEASAKFLSTVDEMMDTILTIKR
ncbi:flagellar hook-associated protein FlgK [Syntrophotalea acetylenivorans]|uniref:Flagellar hook-associated protein 1 n=1 Tax=Syntrophotalea acetylenivorans TaxID=1842532 RepID=A0A1L3GN90_9BACT|nr:flagellar hook-associated protein FlgK [Syntrophotalea acetylenivorans]APG27345.1 flagellar hook-associated protein FlgK [Syntrophotalea acetylenivorans]